MKKKINYLFIYLLTLLHKINFTLFIIVLLLFLSTVLPACPYCVGQIEDKSPPFFLDECYHDLPSFDFKNTTTQKVEIEEES